MNRADTLRQLGIEQWQATRSGLDRPELSDLVWRVLVNEALRHGDRLVVNGGHKKGGAT